MNGAHRHRGMGCPPFRTISYCGQAHADLLALARYVAVQVAIPQPTQPGPPQRLWLSHSRTAAPCPFRRMNRSSTQLPTNRLPILHSYACRQSVSRRMCGLLSRQRHRQVHRLDPNWAIARYSRFNRPSNVCPRDWATAQVVPLPMKGSRIVAGTVAALHSQVGCQPVVLGRSCHLDYCHPDYV